MAWLTTMMPWHDRPDRHGNERGRVVKPVLQRLWAAFPYHDRYPTLEDLYTWLGVQAAKNIHAKGFGVKGNSCASRLSVAFNRAGVPIHAGGGLATLGVGDWQGATGHVALWNGTTYREPAHDDYAAFVNPVLPAIRTSRGKFRELG